MENFAYTFDHLADVVEKFIGAVHLGKFSLYVQDYGAPVGFRIATRHPEWIDGLIVQNGDAYEEGFTPAWEGLRALCRTELPIPKLGLRVFSPETTRLFYTAGVSDLENVSPDNWNLDQYFLDRPANRAAQMELFYDCRTNPRRYPEWHEYFRKHQPRTLLVWGQNDPFFGPEGAKAFLRDLPEAELHLFDTGHFALDEEGEAIAGLIRDFHRA